MHRVRTLFVGFLASLVGAAASAQLGPVGTAFWNEGSPDLVSSLQADVRFGAALAAGDFDCNGFDDLAIGVPDDDDNNGMLLNTGYVMVLYGTDIGPAAPGHQLWDQQSLAAMTEEEDDHFGETLAAGDFNGDGCDDLAIGAPQEDIGTETDAGMVQIVYGSVDGLTDLGNEVFRQGANGISAAPEPVDNFGLSLAVGDFNDDEIDDLAIGAPGEDIEAEGVFNAGAIHVLFGSVLSGLTGDDDLVYFRGNGLPGVPEVGERLGDALAAGNFDPLFFPGDELAIGAPFSGEPPAVSDEGRVVIVADLGGADFVVEINQASPDVPGASEANDHFGATLAAGDFDGDNIDELAVASTGEDIEPDGITNAGAVTILDFDDDGNVLFLQDEFPFEEPSDADAFGFALAAGDLDADGTDDLVIGVPFEELGPILTTGIVHVVYGATGEGLDLATAENWIQTLNPSEDNDRFGYALAIGRLAGHSGADLAIGAPTETLSGLANAGGVNIILSSALFRDGFESGDDSVWSSSQP